MEKQGLGVFDSGVGGLTVVSELRTLLPNEDIIYFGDTGRIPYGNKAKETIIEYCKEIVEFLISKKVKAIVIACNTATAHALETLENSYDIPIFGVINAGAEEAVAVTKNNKIGIIGTTGTIKSKAYENAIKRLNGSAVTTTQSCQPFVMLAEEGLASHKGTELIAIDYLEPIIQDNVDTLILGCTHFPLLKGCITRIVGNDISLVNPAVKTAKNVADYLSSSNLLNTSKGNSEFYFVSGDRKSFTEVCKALGFNLQGEVIRHNFI